MSASGGKVHVVGGVDPATYLLGTLEVYDPASDTWRLRSNMRIGRSNFGALASSNGKLYVMGGVNLEVRLDTVEEGTLP
ncbi:MAG: hypothetical protein U0768_09155 [Anaerolineae bacterium]